MRHNINSYVMIGGLLLLGLSAWTEAVAGHKAKLDFPRDPLFRKKNGIIFYGSGTGTYDSQASIESLRLLAQTGATWVSIVVEYFQENINSTEIYFLNGTSQTDQEVGRIIRHAHIMGLKHVDLQNDPQHWRGQIGTYFNDTQWDAWFHSYRHYIKAMANIAYDHEVELFIIGTELSATEAQTVPWIHTIRDVKALYSGNIVYGANWGPIGWDGVGFWGHLDFIGIDAYYSLATQPSPPMSMVEFNWMRHTIDLARLSMEWNKPIIFTEIGYESMADTAMHPWASNGPLDLTAQANCYVALFEMIYNNTWFDGAFWWAWNDTPNSGGPTDLGFSPHGKPAEKVLNQYFTKGVSKRN